MNFSDNIPERLIADAPLKFVKVLDGVQEQKQLIIAEAMRENNPLLLNDAKWLIMRLADYGITGVPYEMPVGILQQALLNAGTLVRLRGSQAGLNLFCSVFSLGQVTFDATSYYNSTSVLYPDSLTEGFITEDNVNPYFYLVENSDQLVITEPLSITVSTKYSGNDTVKNFLRNEVKNWLGFNPGKVITFTFTARGSAYYHPLLNQYFV